MATQVQRRRGTASEHNTFTGAAGEVTVNTTNDSLHVHDGATAGGIELARADGQNANMPTAAMPAGSVIQVKHVVTRTNVVVNAANTIADLGLSIQITPNSTNSKFLLLCKIQCQTGSPNSSGYGLIWFRNNNEVRSPGEYYEVYSNADVYHASHFQYLDIPQTASTITYEAKPETYSSSEVDFSAQGFYDHNLTVMEIAG